MVKGEGDETVFAAISRFNILLCDGLDFNNLFAPLVPNLACF